MRADSGFWSAKTIRACRRHRIRYSITVRQTTPIRAAIATIDEAAWTDIVYPDGGLAQVAETRYRGDRLIVGRTRLVGAQAELFPTWRYHAFVTDRVGTTVWLDQEHRRHAVVELCIRDLKAGVGLRHCPSGKFAANAAWLVAATLAHNLLGWIVAIGLGRVRSWWWSRRCAGPCWPYPAASPAPPDDAGCTCPPAGRGRRGSSWHWPGRAASPTPPDPHCRSTHDSRPISGQRQPTQACLASGSRPPDRPEPAASPSRSCLQHTPTTTCQPGPTTAPAHQEFRHRWIQADIPQCVSEPLPASLLSVTESGQQKGAGR
jgi:hypothetical protein